MIPSTPTSAGFAGRGGGRPGPLFGRDGELEVLRRLIAESHASGPRVVYVEGDAGIGKTAFATAVVHEARGTGFEVLSGRCRPGDLAYPFAPFVDALRQRIAEAPERARELLGPQCPALTVLLPELVSVCPPGSPLPPEQTKRLLFESLSAVIARLAVRRPVLIVAEDLHWSDPSTLEFLEMLPGRLVGRRVLVLLTARSDEDHPALAALVDDLRRSHHLERVPLAPLPEPAIASMLEELVGRPVLSSTVAAVSRRSAGNPLFVEELVAAGLSAGLGEPGVPGGSVPRAVATLVLRRLNGMGELERTVADLASVVGLPVAADVLATAARRDRSAVEEALAGLVARRLLEPVAPRPGSTSRWRFRHDLTRDAVYERIPAAHRRELHGVVADVLSESGSDGSLTGSAAVDPGVLARHLHEAGAWERVLPLAMAAADAARRVHATVEALAHDRRALDAALAIGDARAADLFARCGTELALLGDFDAAEAHLTEARQLGLRNDDRRVEQAALDGLAALAVRGDYGLAERLARESLELAEGIGDDRTTAGALNRLGNVLTNRMRFGEGRALHERALDRFRAVHDEWGQADALDLIGMSMYLAGDVAGSRTAFRQAASDFERLDDLERLASALASRGMYLAVIDGACATEAAPDDFARDTSRSLDLCRRIGWRAGEAYALAAMASAELGAGRIGAARRLAGEAREQATAIGHRQWVLLATFVEALTDVEVGAWVSARDRFEAALAAAADIGSEQWRDRVTAWLDWARVQTNGPGASPGPPDVRHPAPPATIGGRRRALVAANAALAAGNPDTAIDLADTLDPPGPGPRAAEVGLLRGRGLALAGRLGEASDELDRARAVAATVGPRGIEWRIAGALAAVWKGTEREATERVMARNAIGFILEHADEPDRASLLLDPDARDFLKQRPRERTSMSARPGGLSGRELEVAGLVSEGLRNREIGTRLGIAEKTVEMHVASATAKLELTSRAALASWYARGAAASREGHDPVG